MGRFFTELRRRKVFHVAGVYAVTAWLLAQGAALGETALNLPEWFDAATILLLALGFPIAVILAYAFEVTPEGVQRTEGSPGGTMPATGTSRLTYALFALIFAAVGWLIFRIELAGPQVSPVALFTEVDLSKAIAVLPLTNLSPDPDNAYFAAGIHEEILTQLAKISELTVIARTSVLQYRDTEKTIPEIAAELNVGNVMEGSVQFADNRMRITLQLIEAETGTHIWAESYDRDFEDVFEVQSDIATRVAAVLSAELTPETEASINRAPTRNMEAYDLLLRASPLRLDLPLSISLLEQSRSLDPDFAEPYGLETIRRFATIAVVGAYDPMSLSMPARQLAARAMELDPKSARAYFAAGWVDTADRRIGDAAESYRKGLEITPGWAAAWGEYAAILSALDRDDEAIAAALRGRRLDPNFVASYLRLRSVYFGAGLVDKALEISVEALNRFPNDPRVYRGMAVALAQVGNLEDALDYAQKATDMSPGSYRYMHICEVGQLAAMTGDTARSEAVLLELAEASVELWIPPWCYVVIYAGTGDLERQVDWIETWMDSGDFYFLMWLGNGTQFLARDHPRIEAIMARIELD